MSRPIVVPAPPAWADDVLTVGVTGTNGKSTTTTWIAAALRSLGGPVVRATTLGFFLDDDELGLEKSYDGFVEAMRRGHAKGARHAAIELTSEALARGFAKAWPCRVAVFTNLTHDHLDAHGSPEHYLASKAQLFVGLSPGDTAILNAHDEASALLAEVIPEGVRKITYGVPTRGEPCLPVDVSAGEVTLDWDGTTVSVTAFGEACSLRVRAIGAINAENALAAWLGAESAGVPRAQVLEALASVPAPPGRFEIVHREPFVVVDYAHTPDALARTLATARTLADLRPGARVTVVFGAGGKRDVQKREPMGRAASVADTVVLTSDNPRDEDPADIAREIARGLEGHPRVETRLDRRDAITWAVRGASRDDVVVLAGMGHEREQERGGLRVPFVDADVAREALR